MPPYDSDSSDEGEDFTETNTLLGYASKTASGDAVSHLGGSPVSRFCTHCSCACRVRELQLIVRRHGLTRRRRRPVRWQNAKCAMGF